MKSAKVYNMEGELVRSVDLAADIFEVAPVSDLIYQSLIAQFANARHSIAHTKKRGEVSGGGKKPWKQKHTGRARHGSIRSPIWKGGGRVFGPRSDRNYSKGINSKMKTKALQMGLSDKAENGMIILLEGLAEGRRKTKEMVGMLKNLKIEDKKILWVIGKQNTELLASIRNLPNVQLILADSLNLGDIVDNEVLLLSSDSLGKIQKIYSL
ncbi:MAG: large subunit ribosomal protein L4 [Parcubacteria group bacterium Gr01-1014_18]|nr:MAG: large subunit ribosomal protein L4 [Parcubacteria group bacterium Greene0416_36]TSC80253.1 MAG: large subunit ribosomal protein L4 [Parcubacteria group bacterium Gr01-1014_18]TSC98232.1 MAG: large subunit ribosomal protein L4 [Parcubacteria group bacterium Greene1014_20]TSD07025.1 MAG: large subunit ribosomal protein L4 [Parcubacteria group bacterium Greene0714_2]